MGPDFAQQHAGLHLAPWCPSRPAWVGLVTHLGFLGSFAVGSSLYHVWLVRSDLTCLLLVYSVLHEAIRTPYRIKFFGSQHAFGSHTQEPTRKERGHLLPKTQAQASSLQLQPPAQECCSASTSSRILSGGRRTQTTRYASPCIKQTNESALRR